MIKLKKEVKVGLYALITLGALYWGVSFIKGNDIFSSNNTYYATYDQVNGIQKSSAIVVKGFKIGTISDITYDPMQSEKIVLHFSIKRKFNIPENSSARIYSDGLLGGKAVEIELGNSNRYLVDGDTLRSLLEKDLFDIAGSDIEYMKKKLNTMADDLTTTLASLNALFTDNSAHITSTLSNLSAVTGRLNNIITTEEEDIRNIIDNMNVLSTSLRNNTGKIDNIVSNAESFTDSLKTANIPALVNNLSTSLEEMNTVLAKVNNKEGTVGKLLNDEKLYDSLVSASSNLSLLMEDIKMNPNRYVHFSLFGGGGNKK